MHKQSDVFCFFIYHISFFSLQDNGPAGLLVNVIQLVDQVFKEDIASVYLKINVEEIVWKHSHVTTRNVQVSNYHKHISVSKTFK